jgi:hypothetical protein
MEYHESWDAIPEQTKNYHRALKSLQEELEAVDWYQQRISLCGDEELAQVLAHNRDEEIEHAVMVLEWLRRNMPGWDEELRTYLFTTMPIVEAEEAGHGGGDGDEDVDENASNGSLGLGAMKGDK